MNKVNKPGTKFSFLNPEYQDLRRSFLNADGSRKIMGKKNQPTKKILLMGLNSTGKSSIALKFLFDFPDASNHGPEENYYTSIK